MPPAPPSPFSPSTPPTGRLRLAGPIVVALAGVLLWGLWSPPGANDLVGGDEGYYGTMARNILADPRQLLGPSLSPLGPPGDKPPLYPAILALFVGVFGANETALRLPSLLFVFVAIAATAAFAARSSGAGAAWLASAFLVSLPWLADASRTAGGEIPLTAFATLALAALVLRPGDRRVAPAAGALLGCAFLCKLWLVAPIALAASVLLASAPAGRRSMPAFLAGAVLAGGAQLLLLALFDRAQLPHWLAIYFGRSLSERVAGSGYAGFWVKHPLYYTSMLLHALALLIPFVVAGADVAVRRFREPAMRALLVWGAGLLLLSAFVVKAGGYAYPIVPAWVALAALGAQSMASGRWPAPLPIAIGLVLSCPLLVPEPAGARVDLRVWAGIWTAFLGARVLARARPAASRVLALGLAALVVAGGLWRTRERLTAPFHTPGYRELAALIAPPLAGVAPAAPCVVGPEAPALAFYLFRTAAYWGTPVVAWTPARRAAVIADPRLRVFVVDTTRTLYGGWPDSATVAWLEAETTEITPLLRARVRHPTPLRVFAR